MIKPPINQTGRGIHAIKDTKFLSLGRWNIFQIAILSKIMQVKQNSNHYSKHISFGTLK